MIQITCKGNSAICTRAARLTSGMVGLQCEFVFDDAWDGLARTAVFWAGNEKRDVLLQGAVCTVPWEVLKTAGYQLVIGVYGTNAEGTLVTPTVYAMCGGIASGADPSGDESTDPTLPVWGQMQGMIGNLENLATASKDNLVAAINEAAQSGGGGGASVELDTTLTHSGKAADAKAVGDALAEKQPKGDYLTQDELPDMTAYRTAEAQDAIDAGKQDTLIQSGATVGQIAKITAVDGSGKPTAWEAVDMPSGGSGGEEWELIADVTISEPVNSISADVPSGKNELLLFARGKWGTEPSNKRVGFKINGRWNVSNYIIASSWRYFKMHIIRLPQGYVWFEQQQNNLPTGGQADIGIEAANKGGIYEPWKMLPNEISNVSFSMIGADGTLNTGFQFMVFGR